MTVERSDMSKFTEGSWQGLFTVNNEQAVLASKQSRKSRYSRLKKKQNYTHVAIQVMHLGENQID